MSVTPEQVRRVAALARLELDSVQVVELAGQLTRILEHMAALDVADVDGVEAVPPDLDRAPVRVDDPAPDPLAQRPEEMAPDWADGFFTLPRLPSLGDAGGADGPTADS